MVRNSKVLSKNEKMKKLFGAKNEDVEFSAVEADRDDIEALDRAQAADRRQLHEIIEDEE
ncbi:YfhD family protein [Paenibacillus sp. 7124]|uniref:YfhD family protein n=1 Tax=Paenibacillus apii TaxID=1850370 RepID=A0A6M1PEY6_9BACL|nr:YfhD family protein [Paenibacillus apii]NGM81837.1 YfhD family protein [Paenibacillus apii]NJJ41004.1 YfhD family protein [Paenibacillus apii]